MEVKELEKLPKVHCKKCGEILVETERTVWHKYYDAWSGKEVIIYHVYLNCPNRKNCFSRHSKRTIRNDKEGRWHDPYSSNGSIYHD